MLAAAARWQADEREGERGTGGFAFLLSRLEPGLTENALNAVGAGFVVRRLRGGKAHPWARSCRVWGQQSRAPAWPDAGAEGWQQPQKPERGAGSKPHSGDAASALAAEAGS